MEKNERIIAITRILPGLETFLRETLANENLSADAERQRLNFVKNLEVLTTPPHLPPRPTNLKILRSSVDSIDSIENHDNDFASVQRKLSNIYYMRRDFDELNEHLVNGYSADESHKSTLRKIPTKGRKKKTLGEGIYEPLPGIVHETDHETEGNVLSEDESRVHNRTLMRGTHIRQSLSRGKWFNKKEKSILQEVFAYDLTLPTISGHLMEVRTSKRRWCVLKDQYLYIFKNQEEPALFQISLPGCDISTVPKNDKTKVTYSFKITQNGVAAVILGIEEEKDLSAWMNALITASVAKNPTTTLGKASRSLPRSMYTPSVEEESADEELSSRRHTVGSTSTITKQSYFEIDFGTYERPIDVLGLESSLDTENYNPPLPPLPGDVSDLIQQGDYEENRRLSKYSGIYEEVGDELINKYSIEINDEVTNKNGDEDEDQDVKNEESRNSEKTRRKYSEVGTSDSEYSTDNDENEKEFHDRWALHSGVLYQKRLTGWNRRYCKIVDNCLRGFRNPNDLSPVLEVNLSACNVRVAETEGKRRFIFQLNTEENESLYFNVDTQDNLHRWIEVISIAATSRSERSATISEDELDVSHVEADQSTVDTSDERLGSHGSIPLPIPERKESLRKESLRIEITKGKTREEICEREEDLSQDGSYRKFSSIPDSKSRSFEDSHNQESKGWDSKLIWEKRNPTQPTYATTPRARNPTQPTYATTPRAKARMVKSKPTNVSSRTTSKQSLEFTDCLETSPQRALQLSKKHECLEKLNKYLDKEGQFSGFILELHITTSSTTLTRRWAVVQRGFLRIYENYGCAEPFLKISLVEAFLKDYTNLTKARFCFMLEYGAGQSILFQTNTHQELKKWINVITLTIASYTEHFGSDWDITRHGRTARDNTDNARAYHSHHFGSGWDITQHEMTAESVSDYSLSLEKSSRSGSLDDTDGPSRTSSNVQSSAIINSHGNAFDGYHDNTDLTNPSTIVDKSAKQSSNAVKSSDSVDDDNLVNSNGLELRTYRSSLVHKVKRRGFLKMEKPSTDDVENSREDVAEHTLQYGLSKSNQDFARKFCELKRTLFSVYDDEKSENPNLVFNLLHDKYCEDSSSPFSFLLKSERLGTIKFSCNNEEDFIAWKKVLTKTISQENALENSTKKPGNCVTDSPIVRKRSSLRASLVEEETKHHEVLRSLAHSPPHVDKSSYSCYVYEVRDSSGNKTIIRRWCVIDADLIQIFERENSREAVVELKPNAYRLHNIENPRDLPFAFKLERLSAMDSNDEFLVIQASNAKDFRELLMRLKYMKSNRRKLVASKSETNINIPKRPALVHSKSEISFKRIFTLARKKSVDNLASIVHRQGHDTWPKVVKRTRKTSRRTLSDTNTDQAAIKSVIKNACDKTDNRNSLDSFILDSERKMNGYLNVVRNSELCRSEVRKWCVVKNYTFEIFDDKNSNSPSTVMSLEKDVELIDHSRMDENTFEIRATSKCHVFRAAEDFEKWLTILTQIIHTSPENNQDPPERNGSQVHTLKSNGIHGDVKTGNIPK